MYLGEFEKPSRAEFRPAERPEVKRPVDNLRPSQAKFETPEKPKFKQAEPVVVKKPEDQIKISQGEFVKRERQQQHVVGVRAERVVHEDNLKMTGKVTFNIIKSFFVFKTFYNIFEGEFTKRERQQHLVGERAERVVHEDNLKMSGDFYTPEKETFKPSERPEPKKPQDNLKMSGEFVKREKHQQVIGERAERVIHQDNLKMEGEFTKRDRQVVQVGERYAQRKPKDNLALEGKIDFSGQLDKHERCAKAVVASKKESVTWEVSKENNFSTEPIKASDKKTTTVLAQINGDHKKITQEAKTSKVNTKTYVIRETRKKGANNQIETTRELISATEGEPVFLHTTAVTATPDIPQTFVEQVKPTLSSYQVNADAKIESRMLHEKETHTAVSRGVAANNIAQVLNTGLTTKAIESHDAKSGGFRQRSDTFTKYGSQSSLAESVSSERATRNRGLRNISSIGFANYAIAEDATAQKSSTYERRVLAQSSNYGGKSSVNNITPTNNVSNTGSTSTSRNVQSSSTTMNSSNVAHSATDSSCKTATTTSNQKIGGTGSVQSTNINGRTTSNNIIGSSAVSSNMQSSAKHTSSTTVQSSTESSSKTSSSAVKSGATTTQFSSTNSGLKKDSLLSSADLQNSILHRKTQVSHSDINPSLSSTAAIQRKSLSNIHEAHISTTTGRSSLSSQHRMGKQQTTVHQSNIRDLIMLGEHQTVKKTREVQVAQTSECKLHPVMSRKGNFSSITFCDFGTSTTAANSRITTGKHK